MKNICVYCGSSMGFNTAFSEMAHRLGQSLVQNGYGLVYGGAGIGLMGQIADAVLKAGGSAIGVIPEIFAERLTHPGLTEVHVVKTMHQRKQLMFDLSQGFIALPGGFGTLEEIAEVVTWAQIGQNSKPCGLLNVQGFFDPLATFINGMVSEGFSKSEHRDMLMIEESPDKLLMRFTNYAAPVVTKWVRNTK